MSNQSFQIKRLFEEGNSPDQIAEMLGYEVGDVLIVLNSLGLVRFNNNTLVTETINGTLVPIGTDTLTPEQLYKQYQLQIAQKLVQLALDDDPNTKGVQAKCAQYINEEATGRNEKRASRSAGDAVRIINIDKLLMLANSASQRINEAYGN